MSEPITERGDPRDRIANQRPLFDATRTTTAKCPVCGELREPTEDTVRHCPVDGLRREGDVSPRPVGCLNAYQPQHAPIPY